MTRKALSAVEVLLVISILGLLVAFTASAVQGARGAAAKLSCANKLRQLAIGLSDYASTHGRFPPKQYTRYPDFSADAALGWMALLLPHVDQGALYAQAEEACRLDSDPLRSPPHLGLSVVLRGYVCDADGRYLATPGPGGSLVGHTTYIGVAGSITGKREQPVLIGIFGQKLGCSLESIRDGLSHTIMVGERPPPASMQAGWWYPVFASAEMGRVGPNHFLGIGNYVQTSGDGVCDNASHSFGPGRLDNPCDRYHFWSMHSGGANWAFADGSVRFIGYSGASMLSDLASKDGNEILSE